MPILRTVSSVAVLSVLVAATAAEAGSGSRGGGRSGSSARGSSTTQLASYLWSYEGELQKGELDGRAEATIAGQFRLEGESIFSVPQADQPAEGSAAGRTAGAGGGRVFRTVSAGSDDPAGEPREIGSFRVSRSGKLTLLFDDEQGLTGAMVLQRKGRSEDQWRGTFREKEGKKTVRTWNMAVESSTGASRR